MEPKMNERSGRRASDPGQDRLALEVARAAYTVLGQPIDRRGIPKPIHPASRRGDVIAARRMAVWLCADPSFDLSTLRIAAVLGVKRSQPQMAIQAMRPHQAADLDPLVVLMRDAVRDIVERGATQVVIPFTGVQILRAYEAICPRHPGDGDGGPAPCPNPLDTVADQGVDHGG